MLSKATSLQHGMLVALKTFMGIEMELITLLIGIALLTMGRKLFWLFIAVIGFYFGLSIATRFLGDFGGAVIPIAVVLAIGGAVLAFFMQRLALGAAGFLIGGYLVLTFIAPDMAFGWPLVALFFAGGLIGSLLVALVFDWALVILTSLTGTLLIIDSIPIQPPLLTLLFAVVFLIGMGIQFGLLGSRRLI
jgi:hypothetical protein